MGKLHDLGFDHDHENLTKIRKKIDEVSKTIDLMMITEYYDESLILTQKAVMLGVRRHSVPTKGRAN